MRKPLTLLFFFCLTLSLAGQDVKQDFNDGEFFFAEEDYEEALYAFTQVYNRGYQDNANINYRIGQCLLEIPGRKTEAIPYLEKAVGSISERYREGSLREENAPPDALLYLGNAYRINMDLEKAWEKYMEYLEYVEPKDEIVRLYSEKQIESCQNAVVAINNPVPVSVGNLGQLIETHSNRYNVVVSHDLQTMAFMGKNPFYNGVYVAVKNEEGLWEKPLNITPSIVSDGNMDVVALSPNGKAMLLATYDQFDSNFYISRYRNGRWNPAVPLDQPINSKFYESHASFSPDGRSIYFSSNRNESIGGMDIFRSDLLEDSTWSEPVNLGPLINTPLNEESPYVSADGRYLYFSSQGHNTIGGFDMFYCELQPDGSWGEPVNLGHPLNTTDDDLALSPKSPETEGAMYLFAMGPQNQKEFFKFELIPENATPVPVPFDESEATMAKEVMKEVEKVPEEVAEDIREEMADEVEEEVDQETLSEPEVEKAPERYLIRPVFFDFDSYALDAEDRARLDRIAELMGTFPSLELQITGHTDAIGSFEYNQMLSERRAASVADYLVSKGIQKDRLKTRGMSESEHVARNRTQENRDAPRGRALNRRAQFRVSVTGDVIIEMETIEVPEHLRIN